MRPGKSGVLPINTNLNRRPNFLGCYFQMYSPEKDQNFPGRLLQSDVGNSILRSLVT